jgi:hypothetical protein
MTEPLSNEERAALVAGYASGEVQQENNNRFGKKPKEKPQEFSRPPVVPKKTGVYRPSGWFPNGSISRIPEEK